MSYPPLSTSSQLVIKQLYPALKLAAQSVYEDVLDATGRSIHITQGVRSMDAQLALYQKGRSLMRGTWVVSNPGKVVTNASPGLSYHCYGLAFDIAWAGEDPYLAAEKPDDRTELWNQFAKCVQSNNLDWGGDFKLKSGASDLCHAEMHYGLKISDCLELYKQGGMFKVWAQLDQLRGVAVGTDWK